MNIHENLIHRDEISRQIDWKSPKGPNICQNFILICSPGSTNHAEGAIGIPGWVHELGHGTPGTQGGALWTHGPLGIHGPLHRNSHVTSEGPFLKGALRGF